MFINIFTKVGSRRVPRSSRRPGWARRGFIVIFVAMLLTLMLGLIGLVVDTGILIVSYRQSQNAADAAALAAAHAMTRGYNQEQATQEATQFVQSYNGLQMAAVSLYSPPRWGPYSEENYGPYNDPDANPHIRPLFVEVVVETDVPATFISMVPGTETTTRVSARAVAGYVPPGGGEGVIVLDVNARPGLEVTGQGDLAVDGSVVVNSRGSGLDQYNNWYDTGYQQYAAVASNNTKVHARYFQVVGGVNDLDNFQHWLRDYPASLMAGAPIAPDPLSHIPVPDNTNGVNTTLRGAVSIVNTGNTWVRLQPGIYEDIFVGNRGRVVFEPGIYVLSPTSPNQGLRINGRAYAIGEGVMFYATGNNYMSNGVGYWDRLDGEVLECPPDYIAAPPADPGTIYATVDVNINNGSVNFRGLDDEDSPFHNMFLFARRRNDSNIQFQGSAGDDVTITGILYAKQAHFKLAGAAEFYAQFVVDTLAVTGHPVIHTGIQFKANVARKVFLVE